jgi:tRNA pseudouridine38-40 synthase
MRYALLIEYDGTAFHGSQLQKNVRTVQGEIELALEQIYETQIRVSMASRTDAGVHARGQVAAFDGEERHSPCTLRDALNFHLPEDIAIRDVEVVAEGFDPRRQAVRRRYVFMLNDGPARPVLGRWTETRVKTALDVERMREAGTCFIGSHDFASFAGPATPAEASTVREIEAVEVTRVEDGRVTVRVSGNAFVHQQVRRMVGALVRIGAGRLTALELTGLVDQPVRGTAGWVLSPEGLCLERIEYAEHGPFQAQTEYN